MTYDARIMLEQMLNEGTTIDAIAAFFRKSKSQIYREIQKGSLPIIGYSADYAEAVSGKIALSNKELDVLSSFLEYEKTKALDDARKHQADRPCYTPEEWDEIVKEDRRMIANLFSAATKIKRSKNYADKNRLGRPDSACN